MAIQFSTVVRNARLDAWEATIGTSAVVRLRSGAQPANCAAADSGTVLASFSLGSDWAAAASGGSKALSGVPVSTTGAAAGTIAHYRIYASDGTTCHEQGSVTATGGGGDMTVDNTSIAVGQTINITSWVKTEPHA